MTFVCWDMKAACWPLNLLQEWSLREHDDTPKIRAMPLTANSCLLCRPPSHSHQLANVRCGQSWERHHADFVINHSWERSVAICKEKDAASHPDCRQHSDFLLCCLQWLYFPNSGMSPAICVSPSAGTSGCETHNCLHPTSCEAPDCPGNHNWSSPLEECGSLSAERESCLGQIASPEIFREADRTRIWSTPCHGRDWRDRCQVQMWELERKEGGTLTNWRFPTVVLEKTLSSPLGCEEIQPVHPQGNQPWMFIGRADAETETPVLWPPDSKSWRIWEDPAAGKDWGQEEKGTTEDEMVGWHHWLNGHEFEQTLEMVESTGAWWTTVHGVATESNMT